MRSIRQLFRQPLRTVAGILVVALAVSVLSVSVNQTLAALNTAKQLNETFLTVALPTSEMTDDALAWIEKTQEEHPEIFVTDASHGLVSAYIPELTADNYTQHLYTTNYATKNATYLPDPRAAHSAAMLVVRLTKVGSPSNGITAFAAGDGVVYYLDEQDTVQLTGTVEEVIGLQEGYDDPTGYTARITLTLTGEDDWEELRSQFVTGERYLFFTMDYDDLDWQLRCEMAELMTWRDEPELLDWDMSTYQVLEWKTDWPDTYIEKDGEYFIEQGGEWIPFTPTKIPSRIKCKIGDLYHGMTGTELNQFRSVSLSLVNRAAIPEYGETYWKETQISYEDENGNTVTETQYILTRDEVERDLTCTDENGNIVTLTQEEYKVRYELPLFARLEGSVDEFLADENNALWQEALDNLTVNCNTFPIIGVEDLSYMADFATGKAEITQGRTFTAEELETGAKVCVMAQSLAEANGLSVGDTIDPRFYETDALFPYQNYGYVSDYNPTQIRGAQTYVDNMPVVNPTAYYYYGETTPFVGEAESYTIVGLYEQKSAWGDVDDDFYAFTPNTIFVPESSVPCSMVYSSDGMFRTLVINSDQMYELQLLAVEANMDNALYYYDNGYSAVAYTLDEFRAAAMQILPIGIVAYAIVMLLFLFLFPGRQGRELAMMDSLGSDVGHRVRHVLASCLGLVIPGTVIGTAVGLLLWRQVANALQAWVETSISVELDLWSLWIVAAVQVAVVAAATLIIAIPMAKQANLMKRK